MEDLLVKVEKYVSISLINDLPQDFLYHNLAHTKRVVKRTEELIIGENVSEKDGLNLILAAWFHDVGYINNKDEHEKQSSAIASKFLKQHNVPDESINEVITLVMATAMEHKPASLLEKIIRDADCAHFASKKYDEFGDCDAPEKS